ncbi:hypothetical protein SPHINGO8AM_180137 [Sphingomonas sp. 8AM]|nr:hypothetical protein SPHINGO8AM_180137 [Sphingomonas sp. 8AM]
MRRLSTGAGRCDDDKYSHDQPPEL